MKSFWNFLKNNKLYGLVNLVGLTVSMAFVLLLAAYVQRQLTTDSFQKNADRTYLIACEGHLNTGYWLDKHLKNNFPEIEKGCCVANRSDACEFQIDGATVYGSATCADSNFFDIFSYELIAGNKSDWHVSADQCMISQKFANTYFADKDPIGRTISIQFEDGVPLTICGVYSDFGNSIIKTPDVLVRGDWMPKFNPAHNERMDNAAAGLCFVMTYPGTDLQARQADMLDWMKQNWWVYRIGAFKDVRMIPLRDVYFLKEGNGEWTGALHLGNRSFVTLLLAMCLLLLAFAVLNYVNMSTALMGFRAKEMATRRLVGAGKSGIFLKIIAESTVVCFISMLLAVVLGELFAPAASQLLNYQVSVFGAVSPVNILLVLAFIAVLGFVAGLVPALLIQKTQPIEIVRGTLRRKTKTVYSRIIIVVQNVVSVVMLVAALTMWLQIRHMINADLGYNTKDILVVENGFGTSGELRPAIDKLNATSCVEMVGQGNGIPLEHTNNVTVTIDNGDFVSFQQIDGDDNYFEILGLRMKQDNHSADKEAVWLNEFAFKQIGIDETTTEFTFYDQKAQIAGIYYDFKIRPLEAAQSAALISNWGESSDDNYPWTMIIKTTGDHATARQQVEAAFKSVFPDKLFEAKYMDEIIEQGFRDERRVLCVMFIFTLLSILVSALGLFAMSSYYMQQEIRSVSVKKVFGAEYSGVLRELVLSFMKMVGVAFVLGIPLGWYVMSRWLAGYGHRIDLYWWIFALAGLTVALIAAVSVLYQSVKTANTNPAEALKKE
ncbi:MAG: FtsX-like permease family protein [Salinivirgaceae bacterium]|nr:FtsX-like permease family protein [Salinivirgaceae bacterium]